MSEPGYVVMPIQAGGGQDAQNDAMNAASTLRQSLQGSSQLGNSQHGNLPSSINQYQTGSLNNNTYGDNLGQRDQDHGGPLKKVIAQQDSLYKYLNWEDPLRTLGSYVGVVSFLLGLHYLPLTQWALKVGATGLGVMSVASFASRSFNSNANSNSNPADRLRPKQYKKVPEATLNATLGDIHDFVQYAVVEAQRIIFGEDLNKTFAAFVGATALFWLIKVVSPFGLSVLGVSSIYLATLIASPRGRKAAREASAQAGNMASVATEKGKVLAQDGKNQAAKLSSQARDTAAQNSLGQTAQRGKESITDMSNRALDTAQSGKQSAADLSSRAMGTGSDISRDASNTTRRLPDLTGNNLDRGLNATRSELDSDRHYTTSSHVDPADRPAGQTVPRFGTATITKPTGVDYSDLESRNPYVDNPDIVTGSVNTSSHAAYSGLDGTNPFANDSRMGATDMEFDSNRVGNRAGNR
ncbi:putative Reticulon-domain-containing protein [Seiridium unicorne]|uniref:Reticulon-domain-containing protein n=1 Tax=Seiridium unicorne TaxID=138068 RepID=A0ABR2UWH1_9PEZI